MADLVGEGQGDGGTAKRDDCALVLSIFKGANFVVKGRPGYKCKLVARVVDGGEVLETGVVDLIPGQTEPNFNAQLAWSFPKKEIQRLRSDGKSLKVECFLVKNDQEIGEQIGYIVLAVKDAFFMNYIHEVDPSTAKAYPLLGTRDPWIKYHPKIRLQLHVEASTKAASLAHRWVPKPRASIASESRSRISSARAAASKFTAAGAIHSLADPKRLISRMAPKLSPSPAAQTHTMDAGTNTSVLEKDELQFGINERGYFELGQLSDNDDLYIVSITVVHGNYFHLLEQMPTNAEKSQWRVEYKSFGFDISSDPFELNADTETYRGFIGDKATARIRSNGATFYKYLSSTTLEFHIFRTKPGSSTAEKMGQAYLDLCELTKPNLQELKYDLEVMPTVPYPASANFLNQKPEMRVCVVLETLPGYFTNEWRIYPAAPASVPLRESNMNEEIAERLSEREAEADGGVDNLTTADEVDNIENFNPDRDDPVDVVFMNKDWDAVATGSSGKEHDMEAIQHELGREVHQGNDAIRDRNKLAQSPNEFGDSGVMEAGTYKISINFEELWIRSRGPILDNFILYYNHHPMGLYEDVECVATPIASQAADREKQLICSSFNEGLWNVTISLKRLSNRLLYKPLTVRISPSKQYLQGDRNPLATCMVPLGNVFFKQEINGKRQFQKRVSVIHKERQVKIGYLTCSIQVELLELLKDRPLPSRITEQSEAHFGHLNQVSIHSKVLRDSVQFLHEGAFGTRDDYVDGSKPVCSSRKASSRKAEEVLETWKMEEERKFKAGLVEKEKAYLRILSEEWKKRDADREAQITERLRSLQQREQEIAREKEVIARKEESLKQLESEIKSSSQSSTLESRKLLETEKMRVRCLQEQCKAETEILKRRIEDYVAELEKKTGRILLLETRLKEKEDEIAKLIASRNRWSDMEQSRKLDQLKTENDYLREKQKEIESQREEYRRMISKLSGELELMKKQKNLNLQAENENLRMQLLASQQRNEMAKDRKSVKEVAKQIKSIYDFYETNSKTGVESISTPDPKRRDNQLNLEGGDRSENTSGRHGQRLNRNEAYEEIKRLSEEKARLLRQGVYSKYDMVIRNIDSKLRSLGELPRA